MKVTIRDVARVAEVSLGTASRALNGDTNVNPEHLERVQEAARKLKYRRLRAKRRGGKSSRGLGQKTIALVFLGMDRSLVSLPIIGEVVHGVEMALAEREATMILIDAPDINQMPTAMERARPDGVILKGALQGDMIGRSDSPFMRRLREMSRVWILGRPEGCQGDCVGANDLQVGQVAAEHLLSRGHRNVAFVNPKSDHAIFIPRQLGFEARIRRAGGTVLDAVGSPAKTWTLPLEAADDVELVQKLVDDVCAATPRPTAIFCPADSIAALVYRAMAIRGVQVGRDISIISTNNEVQTTRVLHPSLTTIDIQARLMGERCVDRLEWRLKNRDSMECVDIGLEPILVPGDSVATLSASGAQT